MTNQDMLVTALMRIAVLQRESLDPLSLRDAVNQAPETDSPETKLLGITKALGLSRPRWQNKPDASRVPMLILDQQGNWGALIGQNELGAWSVEFFDEKENKWREQHYDSLEDHRFARLRLARPFDASESPTFQLVKDELFAEKALLREVFTSTILINVMALATAFYTMQVYDRVVPTSASATLIALTIGVLIAILVEASAKWIRCGLYQRLADAVDQRLARNVYSRFLALRLDQLPPSVGALAQRLRGYESVRTFLVGVTTQLVIDGPMALLFLGVLFTVGGYLAIIPAIFLCIGLVVGLLYHRRVQHWAAKITAAVHFKTGLLVESVEGAETIKSGQGGWRLLSRWLDITDEARHFELLMRNITEHSQYLIAAFQQLSYISLIAFGALQISSGNLTMGGLIACSILSGRILAPVAMVPQQIIQWAHTKVSVRDLDTLWKLQLDHEQDTKPIMVENVVGNYVCEKIKAGYRGSVILALPQLAVSAGDRIGVIGSVGSGKTTLLRLLSGMYKPSEGRVLLDGVDISHISKPLLARHMGYVPQEGRLFAGTLRDNLILGLADPGDDQLLAVAERCGLMQAVITPHPKGLEQEIFEGGIGLSGGQRQLVHITRALLREPVIWLLDEPTAHMDEAMEQYVANALMQSMGDKSTLVLATHKPHMLTMTNRIIVLANNQIVMDGPKDQVLAKLRQAAQAKAAQTKSPTVNR